MSITLRIGWAGLAACAIATAIMIVYVSKPWNEDYRDFACFVVFGFTLWAITPHIGLAVALLLFRHSRKLEVVAAVLANLIAIAGLGLLVDVLFLHPDAQGGIALLFLPFYPWIAIAALCVFGGIMFAISRSRS